MLAIINIPSSLYLSLCPGKACLALPSGCLLLPSNPAPWGGGGGGGGCMGVWSHAWEGKGNWYLQQLLEPAPWLLEGVGSTYDL